MKSTARPGLLALLGTFILPVACQNILQSSSLNTCQDNSGFSAQKFDVVYTPDDGSVSVSMVASSSIQGNVVFDILILAYGYELIRKVLDPCDAGLAGFCPMTPGNTNTPFNIQVSKDAANLIPGIAFTFPDLDAKVIVHINSTDTGQSLACVSAGISNSKTVDLIGVKWAAAVVAGLALASSAIISALGHANAASHVASMALSLCGYFQAQAMVGLVGIPLPPVAQSWVQDFQWSIGIVNVKFMQDIFTWYQRATGGTPDTLFSSLKSISVQVTKRSQPLIQPALGLYRRAIAIMPRNGLAEHVSDLSKRGNILTSSGYVVFGIQRVAFRANIESTNLFLTGLTFFCVVLVFVSIGVVLCKWACELAAKLKWIRADTFMDFRKGWRTILKGILFRITLIGYPPITILCLWEFTQNDSPAEMVLAVFFLLYSTIALGWAAFKVVSIARRSVALHKTPAYILFSDGHALNKWGFLYIQFRASAYYYIIPILVFTLIKSMFIALGQNAGYTQAIAFILLEAAALIAASVLRPWMDKKTNSFNIAIAVVNFLNAICLLIFTDIFGQPPLANGVVGVVFWILNAAFTLILLIMLIVSTLFVFFRENPDGRYRFMADQRGSFMKSSASFSAANQLDALATTARGEKPGFDSGRLGDADEVSVSSGSLFRRMDPANHPLPPSTANSAARNSFRDSFRDPQSSGGLSAPLPAGDDHRSPIGNASGRNSPTKHLRLHTGGGDGSHDGPPSPSAPNSTTPWQRGAGYD